MKSNMRFKNQTSLKRLSSKKRDLLNNKPSLIAILLIVIALTQVPISLKATFNIICLFSESSNTDQTLFFCDN